MAWDYAAEAAWHGAKCVCGHERDQHEVDGEDELGGDVWGCYGAAIGEGGCLCLTPRYP